MSISHWQYLEMVFVKVTLLCCIASFEKHVQLHMLQYSIISHPASAPLASCIIWEQLQHGRICFFKIQCRQVLKRFRITWTCSNIAAVLTVYLHGIIRLKKAGYLYSKVTWRKQQFPTLTISPNTDLIFRAEFTIYSSS